MPKLTPQQLAAAQAAYRRFYATVHYEPYMPGYYVDAKTPVAIGEMGDCVSRDAAIRANAAILRAIRT